MRISDIPTSDVSETKDKCLNLVVETLNGINGVNITQSDIDRCHRVGKKNPAYPQQMIVKFKYWRTRESIYKGRKDLKDNKVFVDLTKRRLDLRNLAIEKTKTNDEILYVFADINCSLGLKSKDGKFHYFNSVDELESIISSLQ